MAVLSNKSIDFRTFKYFILMVLMTCFPKTWEQRKWVDTVDISTEMVDPSSGEYDDMPHIAPGNIESYTGRILDNVKTVKEEQLISGKFRFRPDDVVYGKINPQLGKYFYACVDGLTSADAYVFNGKNGITQKFLFSLLQTRDFFKYSVSVSKRSGMPKINRDELNAYSFLAPNEEEQDKIGSFLLNIDHLITLHQCKCRFSHQIRLNDWEQCKLGDVALFNPKEELPPEFEYVDLESVVGTEMLSHRTESKITAPSRAQRLAHTGDLFYQTVRPYQRNNYLYEKPDNNYVFSTGYAQMRPFVDGYFLLSLVQSEGFVKVVLDNCTGTSYPAINANDLSEISVAVPSNKNEAHKIGAVFRNIDNLITLHQCEPTFNKWRISMLNNINKTDLFYEYYAQWIKVYKEGAIRKVTMDKYLLTLSWIKQLAPELKVGELSRITYQQLLNDYAEKHERQTTMDFHHQIKGAILDAVDEGLIERDPTRKAIIKGKTPRQKKIKYLNQFELHKLLSSLSLGEELNWDWFILLVAKTGMRFSEALAITPKDFDFSKQSLSINKTWDYKGDGGFLPTKNQSSVRKIQIDWQLIIQFSTLVKGLPEDKPIFISDSKVYNSTVNDILTRLCKKAEIPVISVHGLRHTHASLLLFAGVSIASVAQRLGHSSMTTTQKTYLHIIQELENKDVDLVMRSLSSLN